MLSAGALTISALTFNAHLFGPGAQFFVNGQRRETGFYFHDAIRLPQIADALRRQNADLVGLTEIWDGRDQCHLRETLKDLYPYAAFSPAAPGIGRLIEKTYGDWPRIAGLLFGKKPVKEEGAEDGVVSVFTRRHYSAGKTGTVAGRAPYLSEDRIGRAVSAWLTSGPVWGAGLLFLSRFPIETALFLRHDTKADWEHMADKGTLWARLRLPNDRRFLVSLGHYQEGTSPEARSARRAQLRATHRMAAPVGDPYLAMGDFNVIGETLEHAWMLSTLEMLDSGAQPTYRDPNPYQAKLNAPRDGGALERRLDFILNSEQLTACESFVPREDFRAREGYFLSDHDPVMARFLLER